MYFQPGGRGVRVDTHAYAGYTIPSMYDSMLGKLITTGKDRREAMDRMNRALAEYMITASKPPCPSSKHHAGPEFPAWRLFNRFRRTIARRLRGVN